MKQPNVTLYKTSTCAWCHKTTEFLKEHKIKFKEVFVDQDEKMAAKMVEKSGQRGVPVIEIDKDIIIGFDEDALRQKLKIK